MKLHVLTRALGVGALSALLSSIAMPALATGPAPARQAPAPYIFSRVALPTKANPRQSVLFDMNGDRRPDLVSAVGVADPSMAATWGVSVMLRRPDGTFDPATVYPTTAFVDSIQVLDLDGDGHPDVVASVRDSKSGKHVAQVLRGSAAGALGKATALSLPAFDAVAFGAFEPGQSLPEAAAATPAGADLYRQNAAGTLTFRSHLLSTATSLLEPIQMLRHGPASLVAGAPDGTITMLNNAIAGPSVKLPGLVRLRGADVTGDGLPELLATSGTGAVRAYDVRLNQVRSITDAHSPVQSAAGDLDRDGRVDVAVADGFGQPSVSIYYGNGTVSTVALQSRAADLLIADGTGDGIPDLLAVEPEASVVEVLQRSAGGFPTSLRPFNYTFGGGFMVASADFNGDGHMDFVASEYGPGLYTQKTSTTIQVYLGDGHGRFTKSTEIAFNGFPPGIDVGDFNGDGHPDIVEGDYYGTINLYLGNGDGTFKPRIALPTCPFIDGLVAGDFSNDGRTDVAVMCRGVDYPSTVVVLLGTPGGLVRFPVPNVYGINASSYLMTVGDVNGDGNLDLAVASLNNFQPCTPPCTGLKDLGRSVTYFLGQGNGLFGSPLTEVIGRPFSDVKLVDVNGDHRADLVTSMYEDDSIRIALARPDGTMSPAFTIPTYDHPLVVNVADINGDHLPDLLVSHGASAVSVALGRKGGLFGEPIAYSLSGGALGVIPTELGGDARTDLLAIEYAGVEEVVQGG